MADFKDLHVSGDTHIGGSLYTEGNRKVILGAIKCATEEEAATKSAENPDILYYWGDTAAAAVSTLSVDAIPVENETVETSSTENEVEQTEKI